MSRFKSSTAPSFDQQLSPHSAPKFDVSPVRNHEARNPMSFDYKNHTSFEYNKHEANNPMSNSFEYNKHEASNRMSYDYNRDPSPPNKHEARNRMSYEHNRDPSPPNTHEARNRMSYEYNRDPSPANKHEASNRMSYDYNRDPSPPRMSYEYNRDPSPHRMSYEYNRVPSPPSFDGSFSRKSNKTSFDQSSIASSPMGPMSPMMKSPWSSHMNDNCGYSYTGLMGSLVREEGSIYSLAESGDLLYTGSESKNIRVWKNLKEFASFKSNSGLVKAIIIAGEKIFTGHQDGKIRVWRVSSKNPSVHKRVGTLPTRRASLKCSMNPANYVDSRKKHKKSVWLKHFDAISSLSLSEDRTVLYSASWDKTIKVWRVTDFKCLETINAHDDAVNSVVVGFDGLVFSGSADGSVKVWRREQQAKGTKHIFSQALLKQECAVTALSVDPTACNVYCGSSDGLVNFWERQRVLSHGGVLRGHKLAVLCIATLRNLIFSGSADKTICVWRRDESSHICLSVLSGHTGPVKCLAVEQHKEGSDLEQQVMLYSGSLDRSVKIWRVSVQVPMPPYTLADPISSINNLPN